MYGVKLKIWGNYACFTRPEMKVERVSYEVPTPSSIRGILEAIYWKPEIKWVVDKIHILKPIKFTNIRRNEVGCKLSTRNISGAMQDNKKMLSIFIEEERVQRAAMVLKDVAYAVEAHFEIVSGEHNEGKHLDLFNRRARSGKCYHQPFLGCREFPAYFEPIDNEIPRAIPESRDLSWMLYDLDFTDKENPMPKFFRAKMEEGIIDINKCLQNYNERR